MEKQEIIKSLKENTLTTEAVLILLTGKDNAPSIISFEGFFAFTEYMDLFNNEEDWLEFKTSTEYMEWRKTPKEAIIAKLEWDLSEFKKSKSDMEFRLMRIRQKEFNEALERDNNK